MSSSSGSRIVGALAVAALLALGTAGCSAPAGQSTTTATRAWSYDGADGPAHWADAYPACGDSPDARQSPVDIVGAGLQRDDSVEPVRVHYGPIPFGLEDTGRAIEAVPQVAEAGSIELDGTTYELQQFHFHASSEHTVDGARADAELHLVHRASNGELAVLGVLLVEGEANAALGSVLESSGAVHAAPVEIDPAALLPASGASARYDGSLTTPPCSEGVSWNVFLTPATLSKAQLDALADAYPANHRPVQTLHGRTVTAVGVG